MRSVLKRNHNIDGTVKKEETGAGLVPSSKFWKARKRSDYEKCVEEKA
jgi:hypothetical protein